MPIYEYRCSKCGETFEKIQKFSDAPVETHEGCGGAVERLISTSALQFKGSGFYITDYAKGSSSSSHAESKSESKGGESKSDSKSGDSGSGDSAKESKAESKSKSESKSGGKSESKSESKSDSKSSESKPAPASKSD